MVVAEDRGHATFSTFLISLMAFIKKYNPKVINGPHIIIID